MKKGRTAQKSKYNFVATTLCWYLWTANPKLTYMRFSYRRKEWLWNSSREIEHLFIPMWCYYLSPHYSYDLWLLVKLNTTGTEILRTNQRPWYYPQLLTWDLGVEREWNRNVTHRIEPLLITMKSFTDFWFFNVILCEGNTTVTADAWQIGPFWPDALDIWVGNMKCVFMSCHHHGISEVLSRLSASCA